MMTRTRNMADLLDANGDVKTAALDNVPPSNDASALTTGTLPDGRFPATLPAVSGANLTGIITDVVGDTTPQLGGVLDTNGNNIEFPDSSGTEVNRLKFGASDDLQIFHSGSNSAILENGTGNLIIGGNDLLFTNSGITKTYIKATSNGAVELRHDDSKKLETTSTGVNVTGTVMADGLTVDTNTLKVDAANNSVGIGTSSPNANRNLHLSDSTSGALRIEGTARGGYVEITNGTNTQYIGTPHSIAGSGNSTDLSFWTAGSERGRFLSGGGLTFNGDTAAVNALDDYEEGSYTPQISATDGIGTLTYSSRIGRYTKVGNRVMFNAYVSINNKGTVAGFLRITTPFTPANIHNNHVAIAHWINGSQNNQAFEGERVTYAYLAPNEPIVRFYASNGDGGLNHLSAAHVKSGTDFMIQGTFQV